VPLLSSLPIIGPLFKTKNNSTEDMELLIFITPRIIPDYRSSGGAKSSVRI
jgi:type II secretory pathway component GspD/PulD (secretin)